MISIKRIKNSTMESLIGFVDQTQVISVERSAFRPLWKVSQFSDLPDDIAKVKEYAKCLSDIICAAEFTR